MNSLTPSHNQVPSIRLTCTNAAVGTLLALALASGMGCSPKPTEPSVQTPPLPSTTIGNELDDSVMTTKIKTALVEDASIKSVDFKVETNKGVVQLSGFVSDAAQIDRALAVAKGVSGVKEVQNRMVLKMGDTTAGSNLDDTLITGRVKGALMADSTVKGLDISVETRMGEVMLSGFVSDKTQSSSAEKLAAGQEGVKTVRNELSVKK